MTDGASLSLIFGSSASRSVKRPSNRVPLEKKVRRAMIDGEGTFFDAISQCAGPGTSDASVRGGSCGGGISAACFFYDVCAMVLTFVLQARVKCGSVR